jgi:tRNA 2-thiocytidine biosynthesis protein TtcA
MTKQLRIEKKLLHYTGKAIADYNMIQAGDRVLVCVSGGKDSITLLKMLKLLELKTNRKFIVSALIVNLGQPDWKQENATFSIKSMDVPYEVVDASNIFSIVLQKVKQGKSLCPLCSRLRRGVIYRYAKTHGFKKVALGHHRDDLIESLLMSICYSGEIRSMPPKLLTNDGKHIVIRPLAYCQENDIIQYANKMGFVTQTCRSCYDKSRSARVRMKNLIKQLANTNAKVPSNMLNALRNVRQTQLMDHSLQPFKTLEAKLK